MATATAAVLFAALSIILAIIFKSFRHSRGSKFLSAFPGPPKLPLLGSALEFMRPHPEMAKLGFLKWPFIYGPRYGVQVIGRSFFNSLIHSDIEKILSSPAYIHKGQEYDFLKNWLGEGLLISSGSKWFKRRKLLTQAFHFKILEQFMRVFNRQAAIFVEVLNESSEQGKRVLEITDYVSRFTLDVICEAAMGREVNAQKIQDSIYVTAVKEATHLFAYRAVRPWYHWNFLWQFCANGRLEKKSLEIIHNFTMKVIRERKQSMDWKVAADSESTHNSTDADNVFMTSKKGQVAFLDLLLQSQAENPGDLTDDDIREEVDTFMFEGYDTTAASLSWTIHLLGAHPECQRKVQNELEAVFGADKSRPITCQDLTQMKYLECCIKESLRLYPSVPLITRKLQQDLVLDEDTTVPKDVDFSVVILALHRDPVVFPEPHEFIPERFLPENSIGRHPYAYIPFSAGPRNCIGQKFALMEEKVVLAYLLRNFHIYSMDKKEDIVLTTEAITRSQNGFRIRLEPR